MIPLEIRRQAERRRIEALIAATPSPARFRQRTLEVCLADPTKARTLALGGFNAGYSAEIWLVLPVEDAKPPESEKETIEVQDMSGQTHTYTVAMVTPLLGTGCFKLALRARSARQSPRPAGL